MKFAANFLICIALSLLWATATLAQGSEAFYLNDQGITLMEHGKFAESIPYFNKAISLDPTMAEYYMNRGSAYDDTGDAVRALKDFDKAIELDPNMGSAYFNRGLTRLRMARYKEALDDANKDIQLRPRHARSYFLRGGCYLCLGRPKEALADFDRCLSISPNEKSAVEGRARALQLIGRYGESHSEYTRAEQMPEGTFASAPLAKPKAEQQAEKDRNKLTLSRLNQSLKSNPNNADALEWRCDVNYKLGHFEECIADATNALRLNPTRVRVYVLRGKSYMSFKEYNKAFSDLTTAIQFDPKNAELYMIRAGASQNLHNYSQSINDLTKAIELNPTNPTLHFQRSYSYSANKQFPEAISDMTKWVDAHPKYSNAYLSRAGIYLQAGLLDKAKADVEQALTLGESEHNSAPVKAQIVLKQGNFNEAISVCTKDLTECATSLQMLKLRAQAYIAAQKYDEAIADLGTAMHLDQNNAALYGLRALLYEGKKLYPQALEDAQKAYALEPQEIQHLIILAKLNDKLNNKQAASDLFEKAIKQSPNDPHVYESRASCYELTNPTTAAADYDRALSLTKEPDLSLLENAATFALKQNNPKDVLRYLEKASATNIAKDSRAKWSIPDLKARAQTQLKDYESALNTLNTAIDSGQNNAVLYVSRADVLSRLHREAEAVQDLEKAMQIKPDALGYTVIGQQKIKLKKTDEAIAQFTKALELDPKLLEARISRGYAYLEDNHFDKASEDIEIAGNEAPTDVRVQLLRGLLFEQTGKLDEALKQYNSIQLNDGNRSEIYRPRMNALFRAGNYQESLSDAENFCNTTKWKDEFCPYAALIGYFSSQRCGEKEKGVGLLDKASVAGEDKQAWTLKLVCYAQGNLTDRELLALATDNDKLTEAHTYIGLMQELQNRKKSAIEHFRWVVTNGNVHFTEYPVARTELQRMGTH